MPQFEVNSTDLVRGAYQLIRVIDSDDSLNDTQLQAGIKYLNYILSFDVQRGAKAPYSKLLEFFITPGKAQYVVSNNPDADIPTNPILQITNACIILNGNVRWPLRILNDDEYYNNLRPQTTQGQPFFLYFQQSNDLSEPNSCFIEVWPVPTQTYLISLYCKQDLDTFVASTTINAPAWYYEYLEYSLAFKLGLRYKHAIWDDRHEERFQQVQSLLFSKADYDYSTQVSPAMLGATLAPLCSNQPYP